MTSRDDLRIGDVERDEVATALREHFAQGRLDHDELSERLDGALAARTAGDLRRVTADLPGHAPPRPVTHDRPWAGGPGGLPFPPPHVGLATWGPHLAGARRRERYRRRRHGGPPGFLFVLPAVLVVLLVAGAAGPLAGLLKAMFILFLIFMVVRLAHRHHHLGRRR